MCLLLVGIVTMQAQEFKIGSKSVGLSSNGTYYGMGANSGIVKFNAETKTLTLKNIKLVDEKLYAKDMNADVYTIVLETDLEITNSTGSCIELVNSNLKFQGNNKTMTLNNEECTDAGYPCFNVGDSKVSLNGMYLDIKSKHCDCIWGYYASAELTFNGVDSEITTENAVPLRGFKQVTFDACYVTDITGAENCHHESGIGIVGPKGTLLKFKIYTFPFLYIFNDIVLTADDYSSGTNWTWDKASNTLTLNDMNQSSGEHGHYGIYNIKIDNLILQIKGNCTLNCPGGSCICTYKSMTLRGEGANSATVLNLTTGVPFSLCYWEGETFTIDNANIVTNSPTYNTFSASRPVNLVINQSKITATTNSKIAYNCISSCQMNGCGVNTKLNPGVAFRSNLQSFGTYDELLGGTLYIDVPTTDYGINIAGVPVTDLNYTDIESTYMTAGNAEYLPDEKKLKLNGTKVDLGDYEAVALMNKNIDGLTIEVADQCSMTSNTSMATAVLEANTTITGDGSLDLSNGLFAGNSLVLKDVNMDISSMLAGYSDETSSLTVDLTTPGKKIAVHDTGVVSFASFSLVNGTKILDPVDGYYDTTKKYVVDASGNKASNVVFADKTAVLGISDVEVNGTVQRVYDLSGREMKGTKNGLNIVKMNDGNTRKVIKK